MSEAGPTQGAERHSAALAHGWTARPWLARALRLAIVAVPLLVSLTFSIVAGRVAPAEQLGVNRWLWIAVVFMLANSLLVVLRRLTARLIPLVALMKLTLVFPDNAPSRTKAALRTSNSRTMLRSMRAAQANGENTGEVRNGDYLVQLLREVNDHDRLTRGHSERVRAYAELLGGEIGLSDDDMNKLRWAALLHDVGKLTVPSEILNKDGRPTDDEWRILSGHPAAGMPLLEPLREWLGDWVHAADQHHCRWDGGGYPTKLAGTQITLAGRLVAIADAYDVMTSARSYKKPLAPEVARQELTDCAGGQFDPTLVRAFLQVGLGRLKTVAGPLAWLSNLTGSLQLPVPAANVVSTGAWSLGAAATGVVTVGLTGVLSTPPPEAIALDTPVVIAEDATITASAGEPFDFVISAVGQDLRFTVGGAVHGDAVLSRFPQIVGDVEAEGKQSWEAIVSYTPTDVYVGEDGLSFEACDPEGRCDQGAVTLQLLAPPASPTTEPATTEVAPTEPPPTEPAPAVSVPPTTEAVIAPAGAPPTTAPTTTAPPTTAPTTTAPPTTAVAPNQSPTAVLDEITIDEDRSVVLSVLANDTDADADVLTLTGVGGPLRGSASIVGDRVRYVPDVDVNGVDQFSYTISDGMNPDVAGTIRITITPINDPPVVVAPDTTVDEDTPVGSILFTTGVVDPDDEVLSFSIVGDVTNRFAIDAGGVVRLVAPLDHENIAVHNLSVRVSDGSATTSDGVAIAVADVDEPAVAVDDAATAVEDTALDIDIGANDVDPEGAMLTWTVPPTSVEGGVLVEAAGTVTYTPPADFGGTDSFTYSVADSSGVPSSATVTISISPSNDAPVATDDTLAVANNGDATTVDLRLNDSDADNDALTITAVGTATNGTVVLNAGGTATYSHNGSATTSDAFTYTVEDPSGATDTGTVVVTIDAAPQFDRDGVDNGDNCPNTYNPRQFDTDGDGLGDACDSSPTSPSSASFTSPGIAVGANSRASVGVAAADLDGNGSIDAVFATVGEGNRVFLNGLGGLLFDSGQSLDTADTRGVAIGDMNGDGSPDLVFADEGASNTVWLNDGSGGFTQVTQTIGAADSWATAVGDLDADGDVDVVFANVGGGNTVWFNDGTGALTSSGQSLGTSDSKGVSVADLDGDTHLDLVFSNDGQADTVWLNDGAGAFTDTGQSLGIGRSHESAIGDLDGDGDLDIVIAGDNEGDTVWVNDGNGVFTQTAQVLGLGHSRAVAIGDLDGDGDLDIAFGDHSGPNTVWLNDGNASFTDSGNSLGTAATEGIALADLDGDGDLAIIAANDGDQDRTHANS